MECVQPLARERRRGRVQVRIDDLLAWKQRPEGKDSQREGGGIRAGDRAGNPSWSASAREERGVDRGGTTHLGMQLWFILCRLGCQLPTHTHTKPGGKRTAA